MIKAAAHASERVGRRISRQRRVWQPMLILGMLLGFVVSLPGAAAHAAQEPLEAESLDEWVRGYAERNGLPGVAVAVVKDGEIVHTAAAGGGDEPITDRTPLAVGSVAKVFTAFAVLQLVDRGEITLDDPVRQHLPEFDVDDPRAAEITVRQLLSHTSGLPNPTLVAPADSLRGAVARLGHMTLASQPGAAYRYSNPNYWAAARLVEVVSGEPFPEYLGRHVFGPLGMEDTRTVIRQSGDVPGMDDGHVTAYGSAIPLREMAGIIGGAGGVISTAHDMGLWLGMQQRGGVAADGTRLLSEELVAESRTRQPNAGTYALGWQHTSTAEPARVGHDGSLTRYSARVDLVPSSGYGVAVLLDSYTPTYQHPFEISTGVIAVTEGEEPDLGIPAATVIDAVLGLLTLGTIGATVRGLRRSRAWTDRRTSHATWRFVLRLLPQLVPVAIAVSVFLLLPVIDDNEATPLDAFGLWPAAMILLLLTSLGGLTLTIARARHRFRNQPPPSSTTSEALFGFGLREEPF